MNARDLLFQSLSSGVPKEDREAKRLALHARLGALQYGSGAVVIEHFIDRAREAGTTVQRCATFAEARDWLTSRVGEGRRCVLAHDRLLVDMRLDASLSGRGNEVLHVQDEALAPWNPNARREYAAADVGVTVALAGLADSGAIIISSSESESRSVSLLPSEHVALLPAGRILPSLLQAAPLLRDLASPGGTSAVTLVGGPSKTADIEKVLVTGVHGPAVLTIIVVDETEPG